MQNQIALIETLKSLSLGTDAARTLKLAQHEATAALATQYASADTLRAMKQKGVMRFMQACAFIASGDVKAYDRGTAVVMSVVALSEDKDISFASLQFVAGKVTEDAKLIGGVSKQRIVKHIGKVGTVKTIESKVSRTVGKGGFLSALGVTTKSSGHGFTLADSAKQNAFVIAYAQALNKMTDGALKLALGEDEATA
ncbi:hypothetical protein [Cupriavidus metallidurans]|uniref:hypothetical protein n=1 Tax=Cupriavidus metallidurans TaxID=119219 RepID=UPI001CCA54E6|nr:hypothetical protein [Cupriavidus metallidurans]UBM12785.1 hypothetical protein LAI70_27925 [Cupriavidus metallidurans]